MSFILDALKKADAERHANPEQALSSRLALRSVGLAAAPSASWVSRRWPKTLVFAILAAVAVLLAWGIGKSLQGGRTVGPSFASSTVLSAPSELSTGVAPSASPIDGAPNDSHSSTNATPPSSAVAITTSQLPVPPPVPPKVLSSVSSSTTQEQPSLSQHPLTKSQAAQAATPLSEPAQVPTMTLAQLPQNLKNEIAPFTISGSIYSSDPKERLLLVDKRMLHEGDEIAPGLILDSVLQKGAVLRYKGYVFRVNH